MLLTPTKPTTRMRVSRSRAASCLRPWHGRRERQTALRLSARSRSERCRLPVDTVSRRLPVPNDGHRPHSFGPISERGSAVAGSLRDPVRIPLIYVQQRRRLVLDADGSTLKSIRLRRMPVGTVRAPRWLPIIHRRFDDVSPASETSSCYGRSRIPTCARTRLGPPTKS